MALRENQNKQHASDMLTLLVYLYCYYQKYLQKHTRGNLWASYAIWELSKDTSEHVPNAFLHLVCPWPSVFHSDWLVFMQTTTSIRNLVGLIGWKNTCNGADKGKKRNQRELFSLLPLKKCRHCRFSIGMYPLKCFQTNNLWNGFAALERQQGYTRE